MCLSTETQVAPATSVALSLFWRQTRMSVYTTHVYGILTNKQRRRNGKVLAPEAFMRPLQQISGILNPREMCVFCVFVYSVYSDSAHSQSARDVCILCILCIRILCILRILNPREMCVFCVFVYSDSAHSQSALADSITSTLHNAARHSQLSA